MKSSTLKLSAAAAFLFSIALGVMALVTPALAACEPVACPAIAKICPDGQLACRASDCNCTLVCPPPGKGCRA
jgi:hypothetical protein